MGRKPNPILAQYFDRGPKLADSSNRYQHTCRACGERFPKGRNDSLITHLVKKCPSVKSSERMAIVLQIHDLNDPAEPRSSPNNESKPDKGKAVSLPFSPSKQNFDGLNVLAEASRRVGANDRPPSHGYASAEQLTSNTVPVDPSLEADTFPHNFLNVSDDGLGSKTNAFPSTNAPTLHPMFAFLSADPPSNNNGSPHLTGMQFTESDMASHGPDLPSIAASANEMLPINPEVDMTQDSMAAPLVDFDPMGTLTGADNFSWPTLPAAQPVHQTIGDPMTHDHQPATSTSKKTHFHRAIAMTPNLKSTHFVSETGTLAKLSKPKARGRFSSERRKEVQQIRKVGACLRCRMLKKSCTGSDPCDPCKGVENPRLWKHPCVRTKLAAEFKLFSVGLQATLSYLDVSGFKESTAVKPLAGRVEAFHFRGPSRLITFRGLQNIDATDSNICFLIDSDRDDVSTKMDQYLEVVSAEFLSKEKSPFLRKTVVGAHRLAEEKNDRLLSKVLELWVATLILVDSEFAFGLLIHKDVDPEPTNAPLLRATSEEHFNEHCVAINAETTPDSFALMTSQLRGAAEKRAANLARVVMGDLERRLLQRQQVDHFETFLVAIIYLNCVERITWMFRIWEGEREAEWPLDKKPGAYAEEGEHFAQILDMLLEMRSLAPKTMARSEDQVLVPQNSTETIQQWFTEIAITPEFLTKCVERKFDPKNCRSMDGKFFARVLRTDNERASGSEK